MQKQYWWDAYTGTTHQQLYLLVTVIQRCISAKHVRHEKQAYSPIQSIFPPNNFPTRKKMRNSPCTVRRYMPHLVRYLVPSWCGVSRTIEDCWKPWGISNPHRAAAPVNLLRDKAGMKTNEQWDKPGDPQQRKNGHENEWNQHSDKTQALGSVGSLRGSKEPWNVATSGR